ncbi:MAG: tryptophan-rich sensory protein [Rubricoccaceae bacterium]
MHGLSRQLAVLAAALYNVILNALAGAGLLFDTDTGAISDEFATGVTPAGPAFSIWSVIFLGVLVFAAWQARPAARGPRYDALAIPFITANLLCGTWQLIWLNRFFSASAFVLFGIVAALVWLTLRLDRMDMTTTERWTLGVPTSLFLAWVTVAAPVNLTLWFYTLGWTDGTLWAPALIGVVSLIGAALLNRTGDVAFAAVLLWAFAWIAVEQSEATPLLIVLALGGLAIIAATALAVRRGLSPLPVTR